MPYRETSTKRLKADKQQKDSATDFCGSAGDPCRALKLRDAARKRRRDEGAEMKSIANLLPLPKDEVQKLDKGSILRLAVSYVQLKNLTCGKKEVVERCMDLENIDPSVNYGLHLAEGEAMLEALEGFFICVGRNGQILYLTEQVNNFLGLSNIEMMGENIMDYIHSKDHQKFYQQFIGMTQTAPKKKRSHPAHKEDEDEACPNTVSCERSFYIRMKATVSNGQTKNKTHEYVLTHWTGRLQFEVCKSSQFRLCCMLALCRTVPQIPIIEVQLDGNVYMSRHDLNMKYTFADPRVLGLLGYDPTELIGRSCYELFNPSDVSQVLVCANKLLTDGRATSNHYRVLSKSGDWIWIQTKASIIFTANNDPQYVVCHNYIISEEEGQRCYHDERGGKSEPEQNVPLGFIDLTMKGGLVGGLPGGARQCIQNDAANSHSEPLDVEDHKDQFDMMTTDSMMLSTSMSPPMSNPLMSLPLTNQINKTSHGSKITAAMSSTFNHSPPAMQLTQQPQISSTIDSFSSMHQPIEDNLDLNCLSQNIFDDIDADSMQWLQELNTTDKAESIQTTISDTVNPLCNSLTLQSNTSPLVNGSASSPMVSNTSTLHSGVLPMQTSISTIQSSPLQSLSKSPVLQSNISPIQAVQVSEPNLAAATSDHAYSAKPRDNKYNSQNSYYSNGSNSQYKAAYQPAAGRRQNSVPSSKSNDSILQALLGGSNKKIIPRSNVNRNSFSGHNSTVNNYMAYGNRSLSTDSTYHNNYPSIANSQAALLDPSTAPSESIAPFSSDEAVRSDILQTLGNDSLFDDISAAAAPLVPTNDSFYGIRAKSHPNSPNLSPASQSTSVWTDSYINRSLSTPASRCGSHSPETGSHSSILERFLTTTSKINPNKGSDDAFPDENFNERISRLNITDSHHRAAADGNLLKQLLTGEIDGQRVQRLEQSIINDRRSRDDDSSNPNTPKTPQTPVTPEQHQLPMLLDDIPDSSLNDLGYGNDSAADWLSDMDIPEIKILMHDDLDEILKEENRQGDLWMQQYLGNSEADWQDPSL